MRTFKQYINDTEEGVIVPGVYMIPRSQMPQIADQTDFKLWLKSISVGYTIETVSVETLKPIQSMVDRKKVYKFEKSNNNKPIIISLDNLILDGHHRYYAALDARKTSIKVLRVKLNMNKLYSLASEYENESSY